MNDNPTREEIKNALCHVSSADILKAIDTYKTEFPKNDYDNWMQKDTYKFAILLQNDKYPPKYIMGLATDINCVFFAGGWGQTLGVNTYLDREGFKIVDK